MGFLELTVLSFGVAADAFAVAMCLGVGMKKATFKKALIVGLYFGIFQAVMPLIGYYIAVLFTDKINAYDHYIAFALLLFLGGKMIWENFKKEKDEQKEISLKPSKMLPYAIATSIDALAAGVSLAFLNVSIAPAVLLIGGITLILSIAGVKLGNLFGLKFKSKAEIAGGLILIAMGLKIFLEHML